MIFFFLYGASVLKKLTGVEIISSVAFAFSLVEIKYGTKEWTYAQIQKIMNKVFWWFLPLCNFSLVTMFFCVNSESTMISETMMISRLCNLQVADNPHHLEI